MLKIESIRTADGRPKLSVEGRVIGPWVSELQLACEQALGARLGTASETVAARTAYARIGSIDFSQRVLQPDPDSLAVLPVRGLQWNDLGSPARVRSMREDVERQRATA